MFSLVKIGEKEGKNIGGSKGYIFTVAIAVIFIWIETSK